MAYGVNAPFGLRPLCSINGGSWTEKTNEYNIAVGQNAGVLVHMPHLFLLVIQLFGIQF